MSSSKWNLTRVQPYGSCSSSGDQAMHATHGQTCQINLMGPCSFRSACFGRRPWAHELRSTDHVRNIDERAIARVNVTTLRREGSLLILGMPHRNLMCPGLIGCPHSERHLMNCSAGERNNRFQSKKFPGPDTETLRFYLSWLKPVNLLGGRASST